MRIDVLDYGITKPFLREKVMRRVLAGKAPGLFT